MNISPASLYKFGLFVSGLDEPLYEIVNGQELLAMVEVLDRGSGLVTFKSGTETFAVPFHRVTHLGFVESTVADPA